jgi:hypothetical protein
MAKESPFYLGIDYGDFGLDIDGSSVSYDNANGYSVRLGYDFNNWLAVEGHYFAPDTFETTSSSINEDISYGLSAFARFNLRFTRTTLYALAGYTQLTQKGSNLDTSDIGYGAGLDFYGTKDTALTIQFMKYYVSENASGNDTELTGVTFGFTHYFDRPRVSKRY